MMRRWIALAAALFAVTISHSAMAREVGPACREASVVDEMTREIRARDYYSNVNPMLVTEQPTAEPNIVHCQVCVQDAPYETTRYGDQPVRQCRPHTFEVRILRAGFVVRDLP